jgi:hypothetical protein
MTDRDIEQLREVVRDVLREELGDRHRWVTRKEMMKLTGKCADTIYRWKKSGQVKTKKVAGVIMYQM